MARLILSLDDLTLAEYNMSKERYTVGRLPDNDVRIDNPTVSGHHSLIINILNDSFLEDLNSTNGTYVNGKLIKKHALQHGDVITVGRHQLRFVESGSQADDSGEFERTMVIDNSDIAARHPELAKAVGGGEAAVAERVVAHADAHEATTSLTAEARTSRFAADTHASDHKPLPVAKVQVLSGGFAGREVPLTKAVTTLGRPGAQVVAITRRADGYHIVQVENSGERGGPKLNGEMLGPQARELNDNDVIEIIGVKMGFFTD